MMAKSLEVYSEYKVLYKCSSESCIFYDIYIRALYRPDVNTNFPLRLYQIMMLKLNYISAARSMVFVHNILGPYGKFTLYFTVKYLLKSEICLYRVIIQHIIVK